MVSFGVPNIVRHLLFRYPKRDPNFDNYPYGNCPIRMPHKAQVLDGLHLGAFSYIELQVFTFV